MAFQQSASEGDVLSTFRSAIVFGSLWAIGGGWATAIREIVLVLVPQNSGDVVLGELGAAVVTTIFGVGVAVLAARNWKKACQKKTISPTTANTIASRRGRK